MMNTVLDDGHIDRLVEIPFAIFYLVQSRMQKNSD